MRNNLTETNKSYFQTRIEALGLADRREALMSGLTEDKKGNILQQIRLYDSTPVTFLPKLGKTSKKIKRWRKEVKSAVELESIKYYEQPYQLVRYCPEQLKKIRESKPDAGKYKYPSRKYTGIEVLPMPSNLAIDAYENGKRGGIASFTEGYFKAVAASKNGLEFTAFTSISTYKLTADVKEYFLRRKPDSVVILYDADAKEVSTKEGAKEVSTRRLQGFCNSATRFAAQFFDFTKDESFNTKLYYAQINGDSKHKGLDDLLEDARNNGYLDEVLEAYNSLKSNKYFTFVRLYKTKYKKDLLSHFALNNHREFYNRYKEEIGDDVFNFRGAKYEKKSIYRISDGTPINKNQLTFFQNVKQYDYFSLLNDSFSIDIDKAEITVNEYLTEANDELDSILARKDRIAIQMNTGGGKTTWALELAKRTGRRLVIAVPTRLLCRQLSRGKADIYGLYGRVTFRKQAEAFQAQIVVCTYDTLAKIRDLHERILIVDESHNLINAYSYRGTAVQSVVDGFEIAEKSVLISGTQNKMLCKQFGFHYINVIQKEAQKVNIVALESSTPFATAIEQIKSIDFSEDKVNFVFLNDRDRLHELMDFIVMNNLVDKDLVQVVTRDDVDSGIDDVYIQICNKRKISRFKLVLCSCLLAEGINIENTNIGRIIALSVSSADELKQFSARFRKMEEVTVHSIRKTEFALQKEFFFPSSLSIEQQKESAYLHAKHLEDSKSLDDSSDISYSYDSDILKNVREVEGGYVIDILKIIAGEVERKNRFANNAYFYSELSKHDNIVFQGEEVVTTSKRLQKSLELSTRALAKEKEAAIEEFTEYLAINPEVVIESLYFYSTSKRSKLADFISEFWYKNELPEIQSLESEAYFNENEIQFKRKWIQPIIRAYITLKALDSLETHYDLITNFSKSKFRKFLLSLKSNASFTLYDDRNTRKMLSNRHKIEIRLMRKLRDKIIVLLSNYPEILEKDLIDFLKDELRDKTVDVRQCRSIIGSFFHYNLVRKQTGVIYSDFCTNILCKKITEKTDNSLIIKKMWCNEFSAGH